MELVTLRTDDGLALDAALYQPDDPVAAVVHLHGKGGNFYSGPGRFIPELTAKERILHLSVNMRCHDLAYTRYDVADAELSASVTVAGGMWERLDDGFRDVAAAVGFLRRAGHDRIFIAGHSSGGFYTADYCGRFPGEAAGRLLLSPLTANATAFERWFPEEGERARALAQAEALVSEGHGHWLIPIRSWYFAVSAHSLLERAAEPEEAWAQALAACPSPVLFLWSDAEARDGLWQHELERFTAGPKRRVRLHGCDHQYHGSERPVAEAVAQFVHDYL